MVVDIFIHHMTVTVNTCHKKINISVT